jgi:two-component sensor histidine kinase
MHENINLLEELESLSKIHPFGSDKIDELMLIVAKRITAALKIERLNAWLFGGINKSKLISIGEYDTRNDEFKKGTVLETKHFPKYFRALHENKIILAPNIHLHPDTYEFSSNYAKDNDVISLMDIPIRIEGQIEGVLCYEKTGKKERIFSEQEQTFAMACAQILASNLEARKRRKYQAELEKALKEKELIIREIRHRIKNNLTLLSSICNLHKKQAASDECQNVLSSIQSDIAAISELHDYMSDDREFVKVNLSTYTHRIIRNLSKELNDLKLKVETEVNIPVFFCSSRTAMYFGMILGEIFQNSIKHFFSLQTTSEPYKFFIKGEKSENKNEIFFSIGDNGSGFDYSEEIKQSSNSGLKILKELMESIGKIVALPKKGDATYKFIIDISAE